MCPTVFRTCTLCEAMCGLSFDVEGQRIVSVSPDEEDVFSHGYICPKGTAIAAVHDDPDRLAAPAAHAGGKFRADFVGRGLCAGWTKAPRNLCRVTARFRGTLHGQPDRA